MIPVARRAGPRQPGLQPIEKIESAATKDADDDYRPRLSIYAPRSRASSRPSCMSGILGWGSIRNCAIFSALNPGILAMAAKVGTLSVPRVWSLATTWQDAHQRLASASPWAASAGKAAALGGRTQRPTTIAKRDAEPSRQRRKQVIEGGSFRRVGATEKMDFTCRRKGSPS